MYLILGYSAISFGLILIPASKVGVNPKEESVTFLGETSSQTS